jgi:hypothetical protein
MGYRTGGRASVSGHRLFFFLCPEPGVEHERWGTPVASYVAGLAPDARPLETEESPETKTRKAVTNPRIRV